MVVAELSTFRQSGQIVNYAPFVYWQQPGERTSASYWTDTFGAAGENITTSIIVSAVLELPSTTYSKVESVNDCIDLEQSFYFDIANQKLYVHFTHTTMPTPAMIQYGQALGFSSSEAGMVYVDTVAYDPILMSWPDVSQSEDPLNYSGLQFIYGQAQLGNVNGFLDFLLNEPIYGNDFSLYYLETIAGQDTYTRNDLVPLASLYVENINFSRQSVEISVNDKRKAQNVDILTERTARGELVPKAYGSISYAKALIDEPEGSEGAVRYRVAEKTKTLILAQVKIDEKWTDAAATIPTNPIWEDGVFYIGYSVARSNGEIDGEPLECRVNFIGVDIDTPIDIIKGLNEDLLGIPQNESFYDLSEMDECASGLSTVGVYYNEQMKLYDAIRVLQDGGLRRFRYEIRGDGKRTARLDDWTRPIEWWSFLDLGAGDVLADEDGNDIIMDGVPVPEITVIDIKDSNQLQVKTDTQTFAASVAVQYDKYHEQDTWRVSKNTDYTTETSNTYHQSPTITIDTFLTNQTDADDRSAWSAERLKEIRRIATVKLFGQDWYNLRIYDMLHIDFSISSNRPYLGRWLVQVLGVSVIPDELCNQVELLLVEAL